MKQGWMLYVAVILLIQCAVLGLTQIGSHHWNIALGVLFLGFWALPLRIWPILTAANVVSLTLVSPPASGLFFWFCAAVMPSIVAMSGASVLRANGIRKASDVSVKTMATLHLAALLSATLQAATDVSLLWTSGDLQGPSVVSATQVGLNHFIGAFVGIMLLAPLFIAWQTRENRARHRQPLNAGLALYFPIAIVYLCAAYFARNVAGTTEILRLLLLVAAVFFTLKRGWFGAVLAVLITTTMVAAQLHLANTDDSLHPQTFIAVLGALCLLLGASIDEHVQQTDALLRADAGSEKLRAELAEAAEGNLHRELRERNRIAAELHDEFGQSLTALQTYLSILRDDFRSLGRVNALETLHVITRGMRQNINTVLERLRPAVLDELGLFGAVDQGAIRRLAEDAGIQYDVQLHGDSRWLARLHDAHLLAAYRLVQESVTNVVRHSHATCCEVRFRINARNGFIHLFVDVRDDGIGMTSTRRRGNGLLTMQHRITALDGRLWIRKRNPGLRLHALLRQSLTA